MPNFTLRSHDPGSTAKHASAENEHEALARFNHRLGLALTFDDAGTPASWTLVQVAEEPSFEPAGEWGLFNPA